MTIHGWAPSPYAGLLLAGIILSLGFWLRLARRDDRLVMIYVAALTGAFAGAKIVYLAAEGWVHFGAPDMWLQFATGKSILGALLGGYAGVEGAKKLAGYREVTGDSFAVIAPISIALGRVGCLLHGCCPGVECRPAWFTLPDRFGVARWPAVPLELAFNMMAIVALFVLRRRNLLRGQHFHLYLIGYGLFRFAHESLRSTPRVASVWSGYQIVALVVLALGAIRFRGRAAGRVAAGTTTHRSTGYTAEDRSRLGGWSQGQ